MAAVKLLKILNPIMFITFLTAAAAVTLYKYPVITALHESHVVYKIHEIAGIIFILLSILHIILNWNWIKSQIFGIKPQSKKAKKK